MKFGVPHIWREPTNHLKNFYYCVIDVSHHRKEKKAGVFDYPDIASTLRPVAHSNKVPVSSTPSKNDLISQINKT
ncbi:hypothetical protein GDO78_018925 [Eleutherodactylus coqui]|uniref:Uncharacterized protein n=1 Tax=Eleutherodactylus coqui TaxID=57060 RepID=A0A8J6BD95_ELECQ|nr:hypothetical protein GDO78_018925 [Eleutherodactylus coqui]